MNTKTKSLFNYIFPALGGLFVTYLYNMVDGIFVGQGVGSAALPLFSLSFIPMALNLIFTAFLFSTKRTGAANAIAISRGIVIKALAIFCLPMLFSKEAIWIAPFVAEIITFVLAIVLNKTTKLIYK